MGGHVDHRFVGPRMMGHGVCPYIGLNEIGSPNQMKTFITINYLFYFIFGFIR